MIQYQIEQKVLPLTISLIILFGCGVNTSLIQSNTGLEKHSQLGHSFGTILSLEATIIDGDKIPRKAYQGKYLMQINKINDEAITDSIGSLHYRNQTKNQRFSYL